MADEKSPYSLIIPYSDFMQLVTAANKIPDLENQVKRANEQITALRGLYSELLAKVGELDRLV